MLATNQICSTYTTVKKGIAFVYRYHDSSFSVLATKWGWFVGNRVRKVQLLFYNVETISERRKMEYHHLPFFKFLPGFKILPGFKWPHVVAEVVRKQKVPVFNNWVNRMVLWSKNVQALESLKPEIGDQVIQFFCSWILFPGFTATFRILSLLSTI